TGIRDIPIWPANATAVLLAAVAVATMHLVLLRLVDARSALLAALVFGFGTSTWSVSANAMWTHTITQPAIAFAALSLAHGWSGRSGVAFAVGAVGRLHVASIAAGVGVWEFVHDRRWRPMVILGGVTALGLLAAAVYYWISIGQPVPTT